MNSDTPITRLLERWGKGDPAALEELAPIVHAELRRLAATRLRGERRDHSLSPTELVAEAYVRLIEQASPVWQNRAHFFAIAAQQMRSILVDHARRRRSAKRGGGGVQVTLDEALLIAARPPDLLALDEELSALAKQDARKARCVELHYFGGLNHDEIAEVLGVHSNTVARDLRFAVTWLRQRMEGGAA